MNTKLTNRGPVRNLRRKWVQEMRARIQSSYGYGIVWYPSRIMQSTVGSTRKLETSLHWGSTGKTGTLSIKTKNLQNQLCGLQATLDRTILSNFIQLRADFKTARLGNYLKALSDDK